MQRYQLELRRSPVTADRSRGAAYRAADELFENQALAAGSWAAGRLVPALSDARGRETQFDQVRGCRVAESAEVAEVTRPAWRSTRRWSCPASAGSGWATGAATCTRARTSTAGCTRRRGRRCVTPRSGTAGRQPSSGGGLASRTLTFGGPQREENRRLRAPEAVDARAHARGLHGAARAGRPAHARPEPPRSHGACAHFRGFLLLAYRHLMAAVMPSNSQTKS